MRLVKRINELILDLYSILFYLATLAAAGVFALYLIYRKTLSQDLRGAVPYFWLTGLSAFYEQVFTFWLRVDATVYFRVYGLLDLLLVLYFYSTVIRGQKVVIWTAALLHVLVCAYLCIRFDRYNLTDADQVMVPLATVFIFYFTFCWFRQKFLEMQDRSLLSIPSFYMVSGIFIYSAATVFLFLYSSAVSQSKEVNFILDFWVFNIFMVIIVRIIYSIAIWMGRKT